jgi:hypothetical protein
MPPLWCEVVQELSREDASSKGVGMIHVDLGNGRSIKIEWHHRPKERYSIATALMITKEGTVGDAVSTMSKCHPNDPWSKEQGRRVSLTRLLEVLTYHGVDDLAYMLPNKLTKMDRTLIWAAYFGRKAAALQQPSSSISAAIQQ